MHLTGRQWFVTLFTLAYTGGFAVYYTLIRDYEFLWYIATLLLFFFLILFTIHRTGLTITVLWALSVWGLLHMMGGGVPVGDSVLYAYVVYPLYGTGESAIIKFDQIVHAYGFAVTALTLFTTFRPHWKGSIGLLAFAVALGAMGLGAVNEIVEFAAVVTIPDTGVGGYFNTGLDLVANAIGAIAVSVWLYVREKRKESVENKGFV